MCKRTVDSIGTRQVTLALCPLHWSSPTELEVFLGRFPRVPRLQILYVSLIRPAAFHSWFTARSVTLPRAALGAGGARTQVPNRGLWHFGPGSNPLPMWPGILSDPLNYKQSGSSRSLIVRVNPDGPRHKWCVKRRPTLTKENQIIRATRITRRL